MPPYRGGDPSARRAQCAVSFRSKSVFNQQGSPGHSRCERYQCSWCEGMKPEQFWERLLLLCDIARGKDSVGHQFYSLLYPFCFSLQPEETPLILRTDQLRLTTGLAFCVFILWLILVLIFLCVLLGPLWHVGRATLGTAQVLEFRFRPQMVQNAPHSCRPKWNQGTSSQFCLLLSQTWSHP